jgi:hypothetical protein
LKARQAKPNRSRTAVFLMAVILGPFVFVELEEHKDNRKPPSLEIPEI